MKKMIAVAMIAAGYWYVGGTADQDASARAAAAANADIVMYSTAWCGVCAMTREFLDAQNIDYVEYDVERSEEHYRQFRELGGRGVPVLKIGREVLHGYNPDLILATIANR